MIQRAARNPRRVILLPLLAFSIQFYLTQAARCAEGEPQVAVCGYYEKHYRALLDLRGISWKSIGIEQLKSADELAGFRLVIVARLAFDKTPDMLVTKEVGQALQEYVHRGGGLLLDAVQVPEDNLAPMLPAENLQEGWGLNLRVTANDAITRGFGIPNRLVKYGAWSAYWPDVDERKVRVFAVYTRAEMGGWIEDHKRLDIPEGAPAIFIGRHGDGRYAYSGMHLGFMARRASGEELITALMAEVWPDGFKATVAVRTQLNEALSKPTGKGPGESSRIVRRVAVFFEPGLPAVDSPKPLTTGFIVTSLREGGIDAEMIGADALADPKRFSPQRYGCLINAHGAAFPLEGLAPLRRYLAGGGGLLSCAGFPVSELYVKEDGAWRLLARGEEVVTRLIRQLLPVSKYYHSVGAPAGCVALEHAHLPHLPLWWPLTGGTMCFYPKQKGSTHLARKLAVSIDGGGNPCGVPLWFHANNGPFPRARYLLLGFCGESHPFNPEAWPYASEAIRDCVELLLRNDFVLIEDLRADHACYKDGEAVNVQADVRWIGRSDCEFVLRIAPRGQQKVVAEMRRRVSGESEKKTLDWRWAPPTFECPAYDVWLEALPDNSPASTENAMFTVWKSDALASAVSYEVERDGSHAVLLRDGRPDWVRGVNTYLNDGRGVGVLFDTARDGRHVLVDLLDRDIGYVALSGGNTHRQHYLDSQLNHKVLSQDGYPEPLRRLDSFMMMTALNGQCAYPGFWSGMSRGGVDRYWKSWMPEGDSITDPKWLEAEEAYVRLLTKRYAHAKHVVWEITNEPLYGGSDDVPNVAKWIERMRRLTVSCCGKNPSLGQTHPLCDQAPGWGSLIGGRDVAFNHLHCYWPDADRTMTPIGNVPFQLNLGNPCVIGEMGMPNAGSSAVPLLSDWGAIYDRWLAYLIGERSLGFLNFYLTNTSGPSANEWGLVHHDLVEKESALAYKHWCMLTRNLPIDGFVDIRPVLVFPTSQFLKEKMQTPVRMSLAYQKLLEAGIHCRIVAENDLVAESDLDEVEPDVILPEWAKLCTLAERKIAQMKRTPHRSVLTVERALKTKGRHPYLRHQPRLVFESGKRPRYAYVLVHLKRGVVVVMVDGHGDVSFRIRRHVFGMNVPEGRSAVIGIGRDGEPFLVKAYGTVTMDDAPLIRAPAMHYVVAGRFGAPITSSSSRVEIEATDQHRIRLRHAPLNDVDRLAELKIVHPPTGRYALMAALLEQRFRERGHPVDVVSERNGRPVELSGNVIVIGAPWESATCRSLVEELGQTRLRFVDNPGRRHVCVGRSRLCEPWSGVVWAVHCPKRKALVILAAGNTEAGTLLAVRKLASLKVYGRYTVAPCFRVDWGDYPWPIVGYGRRRE